jgi:abortive infection bacteriophage resistance protein
MIYRKEPTSIKEQIQLLKSRGLIFNDEKFAEETLKNIGYYRLAGYWWPLQSDKVNHVFKSNAKFQTAVQIYKFDSELRTLLFDGIESIEIAIRCKLNNYLSIELDAWWFENSSNFKSINEFNLTLITIDKDLSRNKKKEIFLAEHYKKYNNDKRRPPSWKTLEILSLGTLSKMYGNLNDKLKSKDLIANDFGLFNYKHGYNQFHK